ncbi:RNA-directed DNA polymerase, eukaryota [Tanacetum coccineum]
MDPIWDESFYFNISDPSILLNLTLDTFVYNNVKGNHSRSFIGKASITGTSFVPYSDVVVLHYPLEKRGILSGVVDVLGSGFDVLGSGFLGEKGVNWISSEFCRVNVLSGLIYLRQSGDWKQHKITGEYNVEGKRKGRFQKEVKVTKEYDSNNIHAKFSQGRLRITLPKKVMTPPVPESPPPMVTSSPPDDDQSNNMNTNGKSVVPSVKSKVGQVLRSKEFTQIVVNLGFAVIEFLEGDISNSEIRDAVWECGGSDFCDAVICFFADGFFPKGNNASFITLIPKVIDAKFVTDFRPISLIGSVYKVVTKILANRLSSVISDLVSESQSAFIANRQILDGPFILNEILSWCNRKKKQALIFKADFAKAYDSVRWDYLLEVLHAFGFGANWYKWIRGIFTSTMASVLINGSPSSEFPSTVGLRLHESLTISHLFYADDAVFVGEWSHENLVNLIRTVPLFLDLCWERARAIVQKIQSRLSKWKSKTLSIGGRLTLVKSVLGAAPLYHMSIYKAPKKVLNVLESIRSKFFNGIDPLERKITWIAWDKILVSKKKGGLGVSSLYALNRALLLKWVWRFISNDGSLWSRVISALYGDSLGSHAVNFPSTWCYIVREMQSLVSKGFDFMSRIKKRVDISVADKWNASDLKASFRRDVRNGAELQQWLEMVSVLDSVSLSSSADRCKINVFAWRARLDRLPTRCNLLYRGVEIESSLCPVCGLLPEDISHILFKCDLAVSICRRICHWWNINWIEVNSFVDWTGWFSSIRLPSKIKQMLEGTFYVAWWHLWNFRNQTIFNANPPRRSVIFDDIVSRSFMWCTSRCAKTFSWESWLKTPYLISL